MPVFEIDALGDPRWTSIVESHSRSSIFHSREWLLALNRTYDFQPRVFTTSPDGVALTNGIVFCQLDSWLTGAKLVSLPFSDHCDPLVNEESDLSVLLSALAKRTSARFKYVEIRPRFCAPDAATGWARQTQFYFHVLDLRPTLEELHARLHKDGIQRKIRRAEREHIVIAEGRSALLLQQFYDLLLLTRRRHRLPPQPLAWFRNLVECLGDRLTIKVASVNDRPIASLLTLRHKRTVVYKYGCSNEQFHNLGGMPFLFWHTIRQAKAEGMEELDLGRSDETNPGLVKFKDHLGASKNSLAYWQFPRREASNTGGLNAALKSPLIQSVLSHLPDRLFRLAGEIFYRHAG